MWRKKLCLGLGDFGIPPEAQLRVMAETGFDAFFFGLDPRIDPVRLAAYGRSLGLTLQSVHAPFGRARDMWHGDAAAGQAALDEHLASLAAAAAVGAPVMVVHAFIGFHDHAPNAAGVERYGALVRAAERAGVKIAVENTEGEEYLAALMDAFRGEPAAGFCWDSGHELCYNRGKDMLALYGDRLICTHLNDNLGIRDFGGTITNVDDLHLLPFDGIADWDDAARRLARCGFDGPLTFELCARPRHGRRESETYLRLSPEEFLVESYKRACRVGAGVLRAEAAR